MLIEVNYMLQNDCYRVKRTIVPRGIMIHSTAVPGIMARQWFSRWNKPGVGKCVHAFVDDGLICQYLPWNHRSWHAGVGAGNDGYISMEICEPSNLKDVDYFSRAFKNAVELTAYLCRSYSIAPDKVISHKEGYERGIATNHQDPMHWFVLHGKSMEAFRMEVKLLLEDVRSIIRDVKAIQLYLNGVDNAKLQVDGSYGRLTKRALLIYWQRNTVIMADGLWGPRSFEAAKINQLSKGSKGELVRIMQMALIGRGYSLDGYGADGSFGPITLEAIKSFQRNQGISVDGICGRSTWEGLLK